MGPEEEEPVDVGLAAHTLLLNALSQLAHPGKHFVLLPLVRQLLPLALHPSLEAPPAQVLAEAACLPACWPARCPALPCFWG